MKDPLVVTRNGEPIDLEGLWAPHPAFLVCGGPSVNDYPLEKLRDRGVVSLGVNNVSAWVPVRAWVFSDPQIKFHYGLFMDPQIMTFSPTPKLKRKIVIRKDRETGFQNTYLRVRACPNTYGFDRLTCFVPETFFETPHAHWGPGKHQPKDEPKDGVLCTMLLGLRLLHYLGVRRIYLLGVDFRGRDGKCYAFPSKKKERNKRYRWEGEMLERLLPSMGKASLEVYNCNPVSACRAFSHVPFEDALRDCKGDVPDEPFDTEDCYDKKLIGQQTKANKVCLIKHHHC